MSPARPFFVIAALPFASSAFDAQHIELALDIAENLIRACHACEPEGAAKEIWLFNDRVARASTVGGTSCPSVLAALRLITTSYLVAAWTGSSAGFSPLRIRST